jgi:hypothetical protein
MSGTPRLDEWIGGERTIEIDEPDITIEDGQLKQSGTRRIEKKIPDRYRLTKPTPHRICKKHYFTIVQEPGHVVAKCRSCPVGRLFVPGIHRLMDGVIKERLISTSHEG